MGAQYVANLRSLSAELGRLTTDELAEKDEQVAELVQRLEAVERERDELRCRLDRLHLSATRWAADLRALGEELARGADKLEQGMTEVEQDWTS